MPEIFESGQAGALSPPLGGDSFFEDSEGAFDEYCELVERFENRLSLSNLRLVERYGHQRLNLLVHACWGGTIDFYVVFQGIDGSRPGGDTRAAPHRLPVWAGPTDAQASIRSDKHSWDRPASEGVNVRGGYRNDALVFIQGVEFMKNPQRGIPSLVRLQPLNEAAGLGANPCYFSNRVGFKVLGSAADGKARASTCLSLVVSNQITHEVVQTRPKVVDDITNDGRQLGWQRFVNTHAIDVISSSRILLSDHFVWAAFVEDFDGRLQLRDVLFGPFDF